MRSRTSMPLLALLLVSGLFPSRAGAASPEAPDPPPTLSVGLELTGWISAQTDDSPGLEGWGPGLRVSYQGDSPLRLAACAAVGRYTNALDVPPPRGWRALLTAGPEIELGADWVFTYTELGVGFEHLNESYEGDGASSSSQVTDHAALVFGVGLGVAVGPVDLRLGYHSFNLVHGATAALAVHFLAL